MNEIIFNYRDGNDEILTHVHVHQNGSVEVKNFKHHPLLSAFGNLTDITVKDVFDFFEERSYDKSRAGLKDILKGMSLQKYDPYAMCKITKGRTANDNNWIEFLEDC